MSSEHICNMKWVVFKAFDINKFQKYAKKKVLGNKGLPWNLFRCFADARIWGPKWAQCNFGSGKCFMELVSIHVPFISGTHHKLKIFPSMFYSFEIFTLKMSPILPSFTDLLMARQPPKKAPFSVETSPSANSTALLPVDTAIGHMFPLEENQTIDWGGE